MHFCRVRLVMPLVKSLCCKSCRAPSKCAYTCTCTIAVVVPFRDRHHRDTGAASFFRGSRACCARLSAVKRVTLRGCCANMAQKARWLNMQCIFAIGFILAHDLQPTAALVVVGLMRASLVCVSLVAAMLTDNDSCCSGPRAGAKLICWPLMACRSSIRRAKGEREYSPSRAATVLVRRLFGWHWQ